jgi:hypothetical protein
VTAGASDNGHLPQGSYRSTEQQGQLDYGGSAYAKSQRTDARGKPIENLILVQIPDSEFNLVRPRLEFVRTKNYQALHEPGERLDYAYSPNDG